MRLAGVLGAILPLLAVACAESALPTAPTPLAAPPPAIVSLQGEPGSGDGHVLERSRATGGQTLHLAPGERRLWTFTLGAAEARYAIAVHYSNSRGGDREVLPVEVDGTRLWTFQVRDTGEEDEGWNVFATDVAGTLSFRAGAHLLTVDSRGGDGCVEIDLVAIRPLGE